MFLARVIIFRPQHDSGDWRPRPGYHPQVDVGGVLTSCKIESLGGESEFEFDREYVVRLRLLLPDLYGSRFVVGSDLTFYEGSRLVGRGTVIAVG